MLRTKRIKFDIIHVVRKESPERGRFKRTSIFDIGGASHHIKCAQAHFLLRQKTANFLMQWKQRMWFRGICKEVDSGVDFENQPFCVPIHEFPFGLLAVPLTRYHERGTLHFQDEESALSSVRCLVTPASCGGSRVMGGGN